MLVQTSWRYRRALSIGSGVWAMGLITFIVLFGRDTAINRDALGILSMVLLGVVGTYTGGAVLDDRNRMIHGRVPDAPVSPAPVPPPAPDERG